jgi:uncharacterized protein (TIGR03437 family)
VEIAATAPGLFAANSDGQGVAAAVALRVKPDGTQIYEPVARFDPILKRFVPVSIDVVGIHPPNTNDQVFLLLFGTGIRGHPSLSSVTAQIGGVDVEVLYAGAQPDFVGLDQVNLRLPRSLILHTELGITLRVDGKVANVVNIGIM